MATFATLKTDGKLLYMDSSNDLLTADNFGVLLNDAANQLAYETKCCTGIISITAALSDIQKLNISGVSTTDFQINEDVTDSSTGDGVIQEIYSTYLLVYASAAFTADLTITGGTSGATATLDSVKPSGVYRAPSDYLGNFDVAYYDNQSLEFTSMKALDLREGGTWRANTGTPSHIYMIGNNFLLYPRPTETDKTLSIPYAQIPDTMVTTTQEYPWQTGPSGSKDTHPELAPFHYVIRQRALKMVASMDKQNPSIVGEGGLFPYYVAEDGRGTALLKQFIKERIEGQIEMVRD